ncbi:Forkhead box protein J3 [Ceratobasidium theobromae]|uniref:Forkhead box protein J3 n=1 Tax=Ceratobasidium theobromae TaxID=1582974 RepID=A0A5N5QZ57_9AGAM|nr:Forkhead box protein J3 [Ceratobasidium theobromae]
MSYPPTQPFRPNGQPHVARHVSQTQRHHPYRASSHGPTDPPDHEYRYDDRPPYDYSGGSPSYSSASPLPARAHIPQDYPPSAGTSPHTPADLPGHPHPPPPHAGYSVTPAFHPPPSTLYSASTYGNLNGQGLDPAELPNDLSALADAHPGQKPPYPYSTIIRYAIQGSPRQRLTLSELYETMEARFPWFKTAGSGWKNSVRHNLSLNRCFEKVPRPITEPGKGSYWTVNLNGPEGTRRIRKRRSKKAKAEGDAANDAGSQGPSATDTASPAGAPSPSPPPQLPGEPPLPPPGQPAFPPSWSDPDQRWQPQPTGQPGYGLQFPPPSISGAPDSYPPGQPASFNRPLSGPGYPLQPQVPQPRSLNASTGWPHQPPQSSNWPRPRADPASVNAFAQPGSTNGSSVQQRPVSAAQSDASG